MYAKTCAIAFIAIWLFNASLAAPAPEPEPEAQPDACGCGCGYGHGGGCAVTKVHTVPISSHVPIKTTHKILADNNCGGWSSGYGCGYGGLVGGWDASWGNGYDGGYGGWGDCVINRIHHIPVTSHIPIKTTHRILPNNDCGFGAGWGSLGGYGYGCGCGCGYNGWW